MRTVRSMRFLVALVLVAALVFPQGVFGAVKRNSDPKTGYKEGEIILKTTGRTAENTIVKKYGLKVIRRDSKLGYVLASVQKNKDIGSIVRKLKSEKSVKYVQPNYIYIPLGKPNDPQFSRQWALGKVNAQQGWDSIKPVEPVTIAILDTGIDINHPDFKGRLVQGANSVNPLKSARDNDGHGTHVAGIAGAAINNGVGIAGIAGVNGINIMPVKVFDDWGASDISISDGIIWAADHGARVMNMSFGSYYHSEVLNEAIDYAYDKGVVMVAAAGNWASEDISYPAALAKVIAVSATNKQDQLADFSSFGPMIDVCAPGEGIYSTVWDPYKGSTFTEMSGTSMASPMVAGLAALLLAKDPGLSSEDVRQIIEASATDLGDPGWDPRYGHGRINIQKALTTVLEKIDDSNSTMEKAIDLAGGGAYSEKIDFGSDEDWYRIEVPEGGHIQVEVLPAGKVSPGVEIYDPAGEVLASFNTINMNSFYSEDQWGFAKSRSSLKVAESVYGLVTDLTGGDYYIKVFGNHFRWSVEKYIIKAGILSDDEIVKDLNEPNDSYGEAKEMSIGYPIKGAVLSGGDEDWFKVNLSAKTYKVRVKVPDGLDLAVTVERKSNYDEPQDEDSFAGYYDKWFYQTIDNGGQGQDEEGIIILPENGADTYYLSVYDGTGTAVNANYILEILDFSLKADRYEKNNDYKTAASIKINEEIRANFHQEYDEDWYKLEVSQTGIMKVSLTEPPNTWCDLFLYKDPEGEPVGTSYFYYDDEFYDNNRGQDGKYEYEFKVSPGTYYLSIYGYGVSAEDYNISLSLSSFTFVDKEINDSAMGATEIRINEPREGTLYPRGDSDFYVINVATPQAFLVYITPPADLDTGAVVLREVIETGEGGKRPFGKNPLETLTVEDDEDSLPEEPQLEEIALIESGGKGKPDSGVFSAPKPGRYYIVLMAKGNSKSTGRYNINITPFKVKPDAWEDNNSMSKAKIVSNGVKIYPTFMGIEDHDWYKIYMPAKGLIDISLNVPNDIDGVVEVYDTAGKYIGKIDHSMVGEDEKGTFDVPKAGYYFIKAYDYLGNSSVQSYSLSAAYRETIPPQISAVKVSGRTISFNVSEDSRVFIKILDKNDKFVAMVVDDVKYKKGKVTATWNGKNAGGKNAGTGSFKVKIVAIDGFGNMSQPSYDTVKN